MVITMTIITHLFKKELNNLVEAEANDKILEHMIDSDNGDNFIGQLYIGYNLFSHSQCTNGP